MRVDVVADLWSDLEKGFANSGMKSRRTYAERLVSFSGKRGNVKGLQAHLKEDLDGSADAINKYNAVCNMLDLAEDWLLTHTCGISDLNDWLLTLQKLRRLDESRISTTYESASERNLLNNIKLGYVFPGIYGKSKTISFPTAIPGYLYFSSYGDMGAKIEQIIERAAMDESDFEKQVIHVLMKIMSESDLNFPCVFVDKSLIKEPVEKYKTCEHVKREGVPVLPTSDTRIDLDYSTGKVSITNTVNFQVYIMQCK